MSKPGTNQARKELRFHIHVFKINSLGLVVQRNDGEYSQAEYIEESAELAENLLSSIQAIIRNEKLKLLVEIRELAIPNPTTPAGENEFVSLETLNKLEAEL